MSTVIDVLGLTKVYEEGAHLAALDGVSLAVGEGEFTAVMGPSGCGKSTLLNIIAGLDRPTEGKVVVAGNDLAGMSETALARFRRKELGFVFQFFNLLGNLRVVENVMLPAELIGVSGTEAHGRATVLLEELGIADRAGLYPAQLSGGERQRVAIARALVNRPAVVLADEPTGALDSRAGEHVMDLLSQLHGRGQTLVLVTHDAKLAAGRASRVITLRDGAVIDDTRLQRRQSRPVSELLTLRVGES